MRTKHKNRSVWKARAKLVKATAWLILSGTALAIALFAYAMVVGRPAGW